MLIEEPESTIFSESPRDDLWRRLDAYTIDESATQLLARRHAGVVPDPQLVSDVAASFEQAREYFDAMHAATMSTAPVHLYYGMLSLMRALTIIRSGKPLAVEHHGMRHRYSDGSTSLLDLAKVEFEGSKSGALHAYTDGLPGEQPIVGGTSLSLKECLYFVAEVRSAYTTCFGPFHGAIPVTRFRDDRGEIVDRILLDHLPNREQDLPRLGASLDAYLKPQVADSKWAVLRPKYASKPDPTFRTIDGTRMLLLGVDIAGRPFRPHRLVPYLMASLILSSLSRYYPLQWRKFCRSRAGSEWLLVQAFLRSAERDFPGQILNLVDGREYVFTNRREEDRRDGRFVSETRCIELIRDEFEKRGRM